MDTIISADERILALIINASPEDAARWLASQTAPEQTGAANHDESL